MRFGFLIQFESLLTAYNDELAMLEDFVVGVKDLRKVRLQVCFQVVMQSHVGAKGRARVVTVEVKKGAGLLGLYLRQ
jgi:hypothetical protein